MRNSITLKVILATLLPNLPERSTGTSSIPWICVLLRQWRLKMKYKFPRWFLHKINKNNKPRPKPREPYFKRRLLKASRNKSIWINELQYKKVSKLLICLLDNFIPWISTIQFFKPITIKAETKIKTPLMICPLFSIICSTSLPF